MKKTTGTMTIVLMALALSATALTGCAKKQAGNEPAESSEDYSFEDDAAGSLLSDDSDFLSGWGTAQLQDPIEISFGDYDAMSEFSKKAQNNEFADGQIVTIDGELSINFGLSIGQRKDGVFVGTSLQVPDWTETDYPEDGSRVKVKGTMKLHEEYYFLYITASPSDITVIAPPEA